MSHIFSDRLELIALNSSQLEMYLELPDQLEIELGMPISRSIVTDRVRRAITMKLSRMEKVEGAELLWFTYWLIVIQSIQYGAGLIGFKGSPNQNGEVEIGYGIDPDYQGIGYTTEAVKEMMRWAFEDKACRSIVAINVLKSNTASQRILEKVGMVVYEDTEQFLSYRIDREDGV
jgi:[ribosomal protein S5]-alanine N-acetyltransferase